MVLRLLKILDVLGPTTSTLAVLGVVPVPSGEFAFVEVVRPVDHVEDKEHEGEHDSADLVHVLGTLEVLLQLRVCATGVLVIGFVRVLLFGALAVALKKRMKKKEGYFMRTN